MSKMQPNTYSNIDPKFKRLIDDTIMDGNLEISLTAKVPQGYVQDMQTGTIYKLETWLNRITRGLAKEENGRMME